LLHCKFCFNHHVHYNVPQCLNILALINYTVFF
jgi:hypothetical protein